MRKFARRIVLYRVPICVISRFRRWLLLFCSTLHWFLAFHSTNLQAVRKRKQAGFDTFPAYREVTLAPCKVLLAPCKDKVLRIPEFRKFLLMVESGIQPKESGIHILESRIQNPESKTPQIILTGHSCRFLDLLVILSSSVILSGAPNVNFRKISVRKTIWDLEFLKHLL